MICLASGGFSGGPGRRDEMSKAPLVTVNPRYILRASVEHAAGILLEGGVVAYPTETMYGLGANALNRRAVRRVFEIKGRSPDKPLIVLVRNRRQLKALVREISPPARALMGRFWPDGLTLVMEASAEVPGEVLGGGSTIALRISGNRVVRSLLDMIRVPLTAPSANLEGNPPPLTAEEVQEQLGDRVDLILDGGRAQLAIPSTILDVREEPATLLREGRVSTDEIRRVVEVGHTCAGKPCGSVTILMVCTGNTCRSAMAGGLLKKMLSVKGISQPRVLSAGTHAVEEDPVSLWAKKVAFAEQGVDISKHRARRLTSDLLGKSDLVLTMTLSQARHIERMGRQFAQKTHLLTSFLNAGSREPGEIEDPMGQSRRAYERVFKQIRRELERILPVLVKAPGSWLP